MARLDRRPTPERPRFVSALVVVAVGLIGLNTTAVNVTAHGMADELGLDLNALGWVVNAYLLVGASLAVVGGRLGDVFGRAATFAAGCATFAIGSLVASTATSSWVLLAGRAGQGVGAALILPASIEVIHAYSPVVAESAGLRVRGIAFATAFGVGPLIGAILTQRWGWRSLFFLDAAVALVLAVGGVQLARRQGRGARRPTSDVLGALLLGAGVFAGVLLVDRLRPWGAGSLSTWAVAAVFVASTGGFVWHERRARHPILHRSLVGNRRIMGMNLATLAASLGMVGLLYFFNLFAQSGAVFDRTAVAVAVTFLPFALCIVAFAQVAAWLERLIGFRGPALIGTLAMIGGFVWLAFVDVGTPEWQVVAPLALCGIGAGIANAGLTGPAVLRLPAGRLNEAAGLATLTRFLGSALAVVIGTTFYLSVGPSALDPQVSAAAAAVGGQTYKESVAALDQELGVAVQAATRADTTDGFAATMIVTAATLGVLFVISTWLLWPRAWRRHATDPDAPPATPVGQPAPPPTGGMPRSP